MEYKLDKLSTLDKLVTIVLHSDSNLSARTIERLIEMLYYQKLTSISSSELIKDIVG